MLRDPRFARLVSVIVVAALGATSAEGSARAQSRPPEGAERAPAGEPAPAAEPEERPSRAASEAERPGRHCAGEPVAKWVGDQLLAVQTNPLGLETVVRAGACIPLFRMPGVLFEQTQLQVGVSTFLSPAYAHVGGYVQLTPLSLLQLRAELTGIGMWVFPSDRGAYFALDSYDADYRDEVLTSEVGESATGWNLNLTAILRLRVPVGPIALIAVDSFGMERWSVGDGSHFVLLRHDVASAQSDWIAVNDALLLAEIPLSDSIALRVGAFDALRWVPEAGYVRNLVGGIATLVLARPTGAIFELQPLVRAGIYTHHAFRESELSIVVGATAAYDFGRI